MPLSYFDVNLNRYRQRHVVAFEMPLFDAASGLCGTFDLLIKDDDKHVLVRLEFHFFRARSLLTSAFDFFAFQIDYKRSVPNEKTYARSGIDGPGTYLVDSQSTHHQLQLLLYSYLLYKTKNIIVDSIRVVFLHPVVILRVFVGFCLTAILLSRCAILLSLSMI